MGKNFRIAIRGGDDFSPIIPTAFGPSITGIINYLKSVAGGARTGHTVVVIESDSEEATGTVDYTAANGIVGVTVNGVTFLENMNLGAAGVAASLASQINNSMDLSVMNVVRGSSVGGILTVTAEFIGTGGNLITLEANGNGAVASGIRLTGGSGRVEHYFR